MMSEPKNLHSLSNGEWYDRAIRERSAAGVDLTDLGYSDGEEVRVVFVLKHHRGRLRSIVDRFVGPVWPEYQVTEVCRHRYGVIVTVEQGSQDAT